MRWPVLVLCLVLLSGGCATSTSRAVQREIDSSLSAVSELTALGDSVPHGSACRCTPYPELTGVRHTSNDSVPGFTTSDVINQLRTNRTVIAHVARSNAVMLEIGANDIAFSPACGTRLSCYQAKLPGATRNIEAIVARVDQLTAPRHVPFVLLDYWNVWLGGRVGAAQGADYVRTSHELSDELGDAIHEIARATSSTYVDLRTEFLGPRHDEDETALLAADGDHPNAEGHTRIAIAIARAMDLAPIPA